MALNFGQTLFPSRGEIVPSINYIELLSGQGYVSFYPTMGYNTSGTIDNSLTQTTIGSAETSLKADSGATLAALTKIIDEDFDILINKSGTMRGRIILDLIRKATSTNINNEYKILINAKRVTGGVETSLGTAYFEQTGTTSGLGEYLRTPLFIDLVGDQRLNINDTFRLTVEVWLKQPSLSYPITVNVYIDPSSRLTLDSDTGDAGLPTRMTILLPFKIAQ